MRRTEGARRRRGAPIALFAIALAAASAAAAACGSADFSKPIEDAGPSTSDVAAPGLEAGSGSPDAGGGADACPTDDFTVVAPLARAPTSIAVDDTTVYFTDGQPSVGSVSLGGGAPTTFATTDAGVPKAIALAGGNTAWSVGGRTFWQGKAEAAPNFSYAVGADRPTKMALTAANAVLTVATASITSVAHGAGGSSNFGNIASADFMSATQSTLLVFGSIPANPAIGNALFACPLATGCTANVVSAPLATLQAPKAAALGLGGDPSLVWINTDGALRAARVSNGAVTDLGRIAGALAVAADDTAAFVLTPDRLIRVALVGGDRSVVTCLSAAPAPLLGANSTHLLWSTQSPAQLVRRAK